MIWYQQFDQIIEYHSENKTFDLKAKIGIITIVIYCGKDCSSESSLGYLFKIAG